MPLPSAASGGSSSEARIRTLCGSNGKLQYVASHSTSSGTVGTAMRPGSVGCSKLSDGTHDGEPAGARPTGWASFAPAAEPPLPSASPRAPVTPAPSADFRPYSAMRCFRPSIVVADAAPAPWCGHPAPWAAVNRLTARRAGAGVADDAEAGTEDGDPEDAAAAALPLAASGASAASRAPALNSWIVGNAGPGSQSRGRSFSSTFMMARRTGMGEGQPVSGALPSCQPPCSSAAASVLGCDEDEGADEPANAAPGAPV